MLHDILYFSIGLQCRNMIRFKAIQQNKAIRANFPIHQALEKLMVMWNDFLPFFFFENGRHH
jgi:hypothetical protein